MFSLSFNRTKALIVLIFGTVTLIALPANGQDSRDACSRICQQTYNSDLASACTSAGGTLDGASCKAGRGFNSKLYSELTKRASERVQQCFKRCRSKAKR